MAESPTAGSGSGGAPVPEMRRYDRTSLRATRESSWSFVNKGAVLGDVLDEVQSSSEGEMIFLVNTIYYLDRLI